jgi:hypothetical protein
MPTIDNVDFAVCAGPETHHYTRKNVGAMEGCPFDGTALSTPATLGRHHWLQADRDLVGGSPCLDGGVRAGQPGMRDRRRDPQRVHAGDSGS